ncbi:MAG: D-alanine--D-alanine ligase family protein [Tissierellia bacterium]|nr:D-alanine--D-alanine ligase family protein [Tissierellia bacterium]
MQDIHVIYGSVSTEHEISLRSAQQIINNLDKDKYRVSMTYVTKDGRFVVSGFFKEEIKKAEDLIRESLLNQKESIMQFIDFVNGLDDPIAIPCIHGSSGEDGQIQGFLRTLGLRFVGNDIGSSAICWDKATTNKMLESYQIPQAKFLVIDRKRYERDEDKQSIISNIFDMCGESVFVKPSANGSSVGVNKADRTNIIQALEEAFLYDNKVVCEEAISGEELEVSVIGNANPKASLPGSYSTTREIFDYTAKYHDSQTIRNTPHKLNDTLNKKVRQLAIDAYLATGCQGFARVDIFMDEDDNFYVNEINTFPGMTQSSLSADLWKATDGTTYSEILDELIQLAIEKFDQEKTLKRGL